MTLRRLAATLAAAVVVTALSVLSAPAAGAVDVDMCSSRSAPEPRRPTQGPRGLIVQPPVEPFTGDPWNEEADPHDLYRKYGTAGLWWPVYDSGCNPASQATRSTENGIANVAGELSNVMIETTAAVRSWSWRTSWLRPIDETVDAFASTLGGSTSALLGVGLIAAGGWIAMRARRADLSETGRLGGWAVAMMVLGVTATSAPTTLAGWADDYGSGAALLVEDIIAGTDASGSGRAAGAPAGGASEDGDEVDRTGDSLVGLTVHEVAYRNWLLGMFGEAESRVARTYGPRFYDAMALSWSDVQLPDDELEDVKERKREAFLAAAEDLRQDDPQAFATMQGADAMQTRFLPSLIGIVLTASMLLFGFAAGLVLLVSRLVARFGIMALPIVIPFGLVLPYRSPVSAVAKPVLNAIVTAVMFTIAGALMARLTGALLASSMPLPLVALIVLAATVILLIKLRLGHLATKAVKLRIAKNLVTADDDEGRADPPAEPRHRTEDRPAPAPPALWATSGGLAAGASYGALPEAQALAVPPSVIEASASVADGSSSDPSDPSGRRLPAGPLVHLTGPAPGDAAEEDDVSGATVGQNDGWATGPVSPTDADPEAERASIGGAESGSLRPATWVTPPTGRSADDDVYTPPPGRAGAPHPGERPQLPTPSAPRPSSAATGDDDPADYYVPELSRARSDARDEATSAVPPRAPEPVLTSPSGGRHEGMS